MNTDTSQPTRLVFRLNRRRLFVAAGRMCAIIWVTVLLVYLLFYHHVRDAMGIVGNGFYNYDLLHIFVGVVMSVFWFAMSVLNLALNPRHMIVDGHGITIPLRFRKRTIHHSWEEVVKLKISGPRMRNSGPWRSRTAALTTSLVCLHILDGAYVTQQGTSIVSAIEDQLRRAGKTVEYA